ncbi:AIM24 family protein [Haloarchaeobius amylolyticus]|uniref:AIM24 family protein n=1 Tax=Haloarchaeobius amylolyticus TaxID=1198296 RepID=UPI0022716166|nr:AIM24 family protein [Haloarchaeobius amylolyticus]
MDLDQFTRENAPKAGGEGFQLENSKLLDVALDGSVMAKAGSMVAYEGDISFERKSAGGLTGMLKKAATGEGSVMMQATGSGNLYLADQGKKVQILSLDAGEEISVNGNDVLAFESTIDWDIRTIDSIAGATTGGLFNVYLEGPGNVAITTHGEPLVLETPVTTDPDATVAWSSSVSPGVKTDRTIKGFLGKSSGETYQLDFAEPGGFVIVQPYEEVGPGQ